jgi:hypothetical protein
MFCNYCAFTGFLDLANFLVFAEERNIWETGSVPVLGWKGGECSLSCSLQRGRRQSPDSGCIFVIHNFSFQFLHYEFISCIKVRSIMSSAVAYLRACSPTVRATRVQFSLSLSLSHTHRARHRSLSWASRIQSTHPKPVSLRSILILSSLVFQVVSFLRAFQPKPFTRFSPLYMPRLPHSPWLALWYLGMSTNFMYILNFMSVMALETIILFSLRIFSAYFPS